MVIPTNEWRWECEHCGLEGRWLTFLEAQRSGDAHLAWCVGQAAVTA